MLKVHGLIRYYSSFIYVIHLLGPAQIQLNQRPAHVWSSTETDKTWASRGMGSICATPSQTLFYKTTHAWAGRRLGLICAGPKASRILSVLESYDIYIFITS